MTDKHKVSTQLIGEDVVAIEVAAANQEAAAALDVEELVELLDTVDADDDKIFNQDWQQLDLDDLQLQTLFLQLYRLCFQFSLSLLQKLDFQLLSLLS